MTLERTPAVSVIVPVHNVEGHVADCLDSLLATALGSFEIVAVDDGSTDGSAAILADYASRNPETIRVFTKPNGGLGDARNFGMERARGAYLAFVDADDLVEPDFLSALHAAALSTGADMVICGIVAFTDPAAPLPYLPEPDMTVFGRSLAEEPRLLYRVDASACDKLYARDLFERAGIGFPVGVAFEDVPTTYRLLAAARCVVKVDRPLYLYRQARQGSITSAYGSRFLELVAAFGVVTEFYRGRADYPANRDAVLRLLLTHLIAGRYPDFLTAADPLTRRRYVADVFALLHTVSPAWRHDAVCRLLWPNTALRTISTHSRLLRVFCSLPRGLALRLLARMGAFDPLR